MHHWLKHLSASCVLVVLATAGTAAAHEIRFSAPTNYRASAVTIGGSAGAIDVGNFDGDRFPDLVVANTGGGGPSVLFGRRGGHFANARVFGSDIDASTVAAADFDDDGLSDIVSTSYGSTRASVLLAGPGRSFSVAGRDGLFGLAMQFATDDFDGDGNLDIASVNILPGILNVLLGRGDGTFRRGETRLVAGSGLSITTGHFNGDGIPDLAVADAAPTTIPETLLPGEVEVLLGKGDGGFSPVLTHHVGLVPEYIESGRIDGDHKQDLVSANAFSNDVSLLRGTGRGRFAPDSRIHIGAEGTPRVFEVSGDADPGLQLADFDRDGDLDMAVIQTVSSRVAILQGNGRGRFDPAGQYDTPGFPEPFLAADLNRDRCPDLAVPGNLPGLTTTAPLTTEVSVYINRSPRCRRKG